MEFKSTDKTIADCAEMKKITKEFHIKMLSLYGRLKFETSSDMTIHIDLKNMMLDHYSDCCKYHREQIELLTKTTT